MAAFDIDGDGKVDLLAGNLWFKHRGGIKFDPIQIGSIGGRIAVGLLPDALASPLARLEPYGMLILIGLLLILPLVGGQFGLDLSVVSRVVATVTNEIIGSILWITGHT